ncbi:hypothetical protein DC363_08150 [Thalassorhabdomicrobium marinisediminis]|uniref:Uncharacterized protein n=1 Tax=Thalassorhabdomicrobium marinisediminis TaxID=2170577 RepID=A0A2T7FWF6_9RHOB|nr:hypothetical protein DC363_08150 [Thalassorhabdomicrobium marinisediminis]
MICVRQELRNDVVPGEMSQGIALLRSSGTVVLYPLHIPILWSPHQTQNSPPRLTGMGGVAAR